MYGPGDVRFFDRVARAYDRLMPDASIGAVERGFAAGERDVNRVLDLAGGTGRVARALAAAGYDTVVADVSRAMLEVARDRGLPALQADARRLPARDGSFDAVSIADAFHHLPEQTAVLAEIERVIAPGGVLVVVEFDPGHPIGRATAFGERAVGMGSVFHPPEDLLAMIGRAGMDPRVIERGFAYTVAGVVR